MGVSAAAGESSLIASARAGDGAAFDHLIGPLIEPAYRLAVVMLRSTDEAHDAVQEATFKAWRKLDQLHAESPLRPWFFTIVANQCRSVRRSPWWSVRRVPAVESEREFRTDVVDAQLDLNRGLSELTAADRTVLFLFFYLDLPLVEVATIIGVSPQAAKSRVHRAVVKLRLRMEDAQL